MKRLDTILQDVLSELREEMMAQGSACEALTPATGIATGCSGEEDHHTRSTREGERAMGMKNARAETLASALEGTNVKQSGTKSREIGGQIIMLSPPTIGRDMTAAAPNGSPHPAVVISMLTWKRDHATKAHPTMGRTPPSKKASSRGGGAALDRRLTREPSI